MAEKDAGVPIHIEVYVRVCLHVFLHFFHKGNMFYFLLFAYMDYKFPPKWGLHTSKKESAPRGAISFL